MKKWILFNGWMLLAGTSLFAGGIQHNTNQSAQWIRNPSRDATTEIDAVYYNPAGVAFLQDGWHFSLSSQTIMQTRFITSENKLLNKADYEGKTFVPVLPNAYIAYKKNKFSLAGGFVMIGGGGSAKFDQGLPGFESLFAPIPVGLTDNNIPTTEYASSINFSRSAAFFGFQGSAAYKLNDMVSLSLGLRYVMASKSMNFIQGNISGIMINPNYPAFGAQYNGSMVSAPEFFTDGATKLNDLAGGANQYYMGLAQVVEGGGGGILLANGTAAGLEAQNVVEIQGILGAAGINTAGMDIQTARATLQAVAPAFVEKANGMSANAANTADKKVDVEQAGSAITPIVGAHFVLLDNRLNIGLKYELATTLKLKNYTTADDVGMYPDGVENHSDLPAMFSGGVSYHATDKLGVSLGYHYYWDKSMKYFDNTKTNEEYLDGNSYELAVGLEYKLSEKLLLSTGYLLAKVQKKSMYQSDLSNNLPSHSFGLGAQYTVGQRLDINLGVFTTVYDEVVSTKTPEKLPQYNESYDRSNLVFAAGIGYRITR
jgi:long-chain fatty acid transport protein